MDEKLEALIKGNISVLETAAETMDTTTDTLNSIKSYFANLQKAQDDAHQAELKKAQEAADAERIANIVKSVIESYGLKKADQEGQWAEGETKTKTATGTKWPMSANGKETETEESVDTGVATSDAQAAVVAGDPARNGDPSVGQKNLQKADDKKEYDKKEDEDEDDKKMEKAEISKLATDLKKALEKIEALEQNKNAEIKKAVQEFAASVGFKEERGLVSPKLVDLNNSLGVDIVKSGEDVDVTDTLAKLSWSELRNLEMKVRTGQTEGVPRELLGN